MGHIYTVCGKKTTEVPVIGCGDIGAVSKLVTTKTGDTLSMSVRKVELEPIEFAPPCYTQGIQPKVKGAEGEISTGLARLRDDPSFETEKVQPGDQAAHHFGRGRYPSGRPVRSSSRINSLKSS